MMPGASTVSTIALLLLLSLAAQAQQVLPRYYAHEAVHDAHGVIAPWYQGQNGPLDLRVRIAAETLRRYPWATPPQAVMAAPHYVFSGSWTISPEGEISVPPIDDWANGDLGQRAAYVLSGLVDYYRYSGDATAIGGITLMADYLVRYAQTPDTHPWPRFLVSVPTRGQAYGVADPHGFIQLDIVAEAGVGLLRAYQLTGNRQWLMAVQHWADLLAERAARQPGVPPWGRYANPQDVPWEDLQTGGLVFILCLFDELERMGCTGREPGSIPAARRAGEAYLRDVLLPRWTVDDTWGRNYWDWNDPVQAENVTEFAVRYMMEHPDRFPNWRNDCRNIMSLFLNRTSVATSSNGDVYSGAWAYPESSACCGRSLWYGPMELATVYAQYGELADSAWAREMARRQIILATYDIHETGVVEDNIDGGQVVAGGWFKIAHPMALKHCLGVIAWQPELFAPSRENHIVRSTSVVSEVRYTPGRVSYTTFDALPGGSEVLHLAFEPAEVRADGQLLKRAPGPQGYEVKALPDGDCLVTVRHEGRRHIVVSGPDPQQWADDAALEKTGAWETTQSTADWSGTIAVATSPGASLTVRFTGNQVRLIGAVGPTGGLADVYLDGRKQLAGVDCWSPRTRRQQLLYGRNGLDNGPHELRLEVRGVGNPASTGARVWVDAVQWSDARGGGDFGQGGGPSEPQRVVFGYTGREDYVDSAGHPWRPATEFVARSRDFADVVNVAWWTQRRLHEVAGTADPELYRYGAHGAQLVAYFTVAPGSYHVRLKFAETRALPATSRALTVRINGQTMVRGVDLAATAGGMGRAVDLVFEDIEPAHGVVMVELLPTYAGEAMVQAIEVGPGPGGPGATPVLVQKGGEGGQANLLANPGFEETTLGTLGRMGETMPAAGWTYVFASPTQSYVWAESDYAIHPDWGLPEYHSGNQALRTHTDGRGHTIIYQDVMVEPKTTYRASVWVRAVDLNGKGFGTHAGDAASLIIHEHGICGKYLADLGSVSTTQAGPFTELVKTFTTSEKGARVRFILDTVIAAPYQEGHVTWDDASLMRLEAGPGAGTASATSQE